MATTSSTGKGSKSSGQRSSSGQKSSRPRTARGAVIRRPPEKGWPLWRYRLRQGWFRLLDQSGLWMLLFALAGIWILLPRQTLMFRPQVAEGAVATRTWVAERDLQVVNEAATEALQARSAQDVLPIYDRDTELSARRKSALSEAFATGRELFATGELDDLDYSERPSENNVSAVPQAEGAADRLHAEDVVKRLTLGNDLKVSPEQLRLLVSNGFSLALEDRLSGLITRMYRQGVVADKDLLLEHKDRGITVLDLESRRESKVLDLFRFKDYPEQVHEAVDDDIRTWVGWGKEERAILVDLVAANLSPNLTFNNSSTLMRRQNAAQQVGSVTHTFGQGEVIVRRGARINALGARALRSLVDSQRIGVLGLTLKVTGALLFLGACALLLWLAIGSERLPDRSRRRLLNECLLLLTLALLGAGFADFTAGALAGAIDNEPFNHNFSYTLAIPFAAPALVAVLLYGRNVALVISLCLALLVGHATGGGDPWTLVVFALTSSFGAIFALDNKVFRQRSVMTRAAWIVGGVNGLCALTLMIMSGRLDGGLALLGFQVLCGFVGGLLSAAVTSFVVPIFESLFQLTTSIKLIELANPNLPLLRRLAFEAPGTFQHSLAVANLAKAGVEAIDGDSVLIHTVALYHDIGKIIRPQYFIENQQGGVNPHDKIQPSMSALILINHVKEGLELAEKYTLPSPILDAIAQHHGTRLIKFFYSRAKERCDPLTEEVRENDFRYPGPKPQSKEMGVLMLADAVEAASRTLVEPSTQKIRTVLRAVFDDCLEDGQLEETDLTLGDLKKVEEAFQRVLTNIYHRRIEYPGFDFNRRSASDESRTGMIRLPVEALSDDVGSGEIESLSDAGRGGKTAAKPGNGQVANGGSAAGNQDLGKGGEGRPGRSKDRRSKEETARADKSAKIGS